MQKKIRRSLRTGFIEREGRSLSGLCSNKKISIVAFYRTSARWITNLLNEKLSKSLFFKAKKKTKTKK